MIGFAVVCGVFFGAPHAFVHDVISSQLERSSVKATSLLDRLFSVVGLSYASPAVSLTREAAA